MATTQPIQRGDMVKVAANVVFGNLGGKVVEVFQIAELRGMWIVKDERGDEWELDERVLTKVAR